MPASVSHAYASPRPLMGRGGYYGVMTRKQSVDEKFLRNNEMILEMRRASADITLPAAMVAGPDYCDDFRWLCWRVLLIMAQPRRRAQQVTTRYALFTFLACRETLRR